MRVIGILLVVVVMLPAGLVLAPQGLAQGPAAPLPPRVPTTVPYASSVDAWPLSYAEWLPVNFDPNRAYPLILFLHGQQDTSGRWVSGGLPSDFVRAVNGSGPVAQTVRLMINQSAQRGFILMAVNSRSGAGWYINSPCGGPQEQDVLDALAHETALRHVSATFLFGMSMGTEGTLYLAARHPGMFKAIGIIAPATDLFLDVAYRIGLASDPDKPWAEASIQAKMHLFCGVLPGTQNASAQAVARMFENMSPLRFDPTAFARLPIYVTAGGADDRTPNNVAIWPQWLNANNTFVNSTCSTAPELGEPDGCSTTLDALHLAHPWAFRFRFVYEPRATHLFSQLSPADLLNFWQGRVPGGVYTSSYPFSTFVKDPSVPY